jgi:hypothetical protein
MGQYFILDETNWKPDWSAKGADYPIWAMRNRTGVSRGVMKVPDFVDRLQLRFQIFRKLLQLK